MSVRNVAFFNIVLCGILVLTGCKSPRGFGFADKVAPAADTHLAANTAQPPTNSAPAVLAPTASESTASKSTASKSTASKLAASKSTASKSTVPESTEPESTASESTDHRSPWHQATQWLTRRQSPKRSAQESLAQDRAHEQPLATENRSSWRRATQWLMRRRSPEGPAQKSSAPELSLERQLSNKTVPSPGLSYSNGPDRLGAESYPARSSQLTVPPADQQRTTGTPSLVRRSRRPPPDPAPKLQQNQMLASDAATQNPYVNLAPPQATEPPSGKSLQQIIESASRSWHTAAAPDTSLVVGPLVAANPATTSPTAPANEGLNFLPPNLEKLRTSSDVVASTFSHATISPSAGEETAKGDSAPQTNKQADRSATTPRRADLMASRPLRPQTSPDREAAADKSNDKSNDKSASGAEPSATTPSVKWIAKKTESVQEQPETTIALSEETLSEETLSEETTKANNPLGVVANALATNMFSPQPSFDTPQTRAASPQSNVDAHRSNNVPRQPTSTFPLPVSSKAEPAQKALRPQTNRSTLPSGKAYYRPLLSVSKVQETPTQVSSDRSTTATGPQLERLALSPAATPASRSQTEQKRRDTLLPKPVPVTRPPQSYYSYYHRGLLPQPFSLKRQPSNATPTTSSEVELAAQSPPAETLAPLIDGDVYRQQLAPEQRDWAAAQTGATESAEQPASGGTWLATYQKLVARGVRPQSTERASETTTKRSLQSDDSQ